MCAQDVGTNSLSKASFRSVRRDDRPLKQRPSAYRDSVALCGDPAITEHLAWFLKRNSEVLLQKVSRPQRTRKSATADRGALQWRRVQGGHFA